jgi:predicted ATP-dependent endonuclease of OLD family
MILKKIAITNFKGVGETKKIIFDVFNSIVGRNDAGKSTILKAIDAVLNNTVIVQTDFNAFAEGSQIVIDLCFDFRAKAIALGEEIATSAEAEELTDSDGLVVWRKTWTVTESAISKPKNSIYRKVYAGESDFLFKTEAQLITQCGTNDIVTSKGNGAEFNNVEKRRKIRAFNHEHNIPFHYEFSDVPGSGNSKVRLIGDSIYKELPSFQYFKADTSLSETDNTIQKYFKNLAFDLISNEVDTELIEGIVRTQLGAVLQKVTAKINDVVGTDESVEPKIKFDWSKLITISFLSTSSGKNIPLSSRGDGFRRITMMSYFEYLAESQRSENTKQIIFGFEEPETFLHPSAQEKLYEKIVSLSENGFQVITSTHSPTIVGNTKKENIIHISNPENVYTINQTDIDFKILATDLGIKPDNTFTPLFSTSKVLFLVEGPDDVLAMHHQATLYKAENKIPHTFEDLDICIIPIGGCGSIKHWVNFQLFTKLEKPYFIFLDSDKEHEEDVSKNHTILVEYNLKPEVNFLISKKRLLENYIHPEALQRLVPGATITYGDFDHAKNFCKNYSDSGTRARIGGKNVIEKHYRNLTFEELRQTWFKDGHDEFIHLYNAVKGKLQAV